MFRSIVVGTDGSDTARKAVDEAIDLAKALSAKLCVVSAYEPVPQSRLREEARQVPEDLQWMINPSRRSRARATPPTRSSTWLKSAAPT
jgi:nucleotide-binding universal stress UspA family protein